jgi:phage virion morphogenesis protein
MSLQLNINMSQIDRLGARIQALGNIDRSELLEGLAAEVESQTRRRLSDEKTAPDGTPWAAWTDDYAATRHGGHSLLESSGALIDSIESVASDDSVEIGSNLIYAAIHNLGGTEDMAPAPAGITARQYLGFSDDNLTDLQFVVDDFIDAAIQEHLKAGAL